MDTKDNASNLIPGQGRPADLVRLKRLASQGPLPADSAAGDLSAKPRRIRRAGGVLAGAVLAAALSAAGALALLDGDGPLRALMRDPSPERPDQGLAAADRERFWSLAEFEPARFQALLGVPEADAAMRELDASQPHRLLSGKAGPRSP